MESTETINYFATNVSTIKELFNILFFIVVGSVTVLTYLKANKSILQPMENEIFKNQLTEFTNIMDIFNGKSEVELREYFGLSDLIKVNAFFMLDNYASLFFGMNIDKERRPYNHEFYNLEETADKLTDYLREYLNVDSLLDK